MMCLVIVLIQIITFNFLCGNVYLVSQHNNFKSTGQYENWDPNLGHSSYQGHSRFDHVRENFRNINDRTFSESDFDSPKGRIEASDETDSFANEDYIRHTTDIYLNAKSHDQVFETDLSNHRERYNVNANKKPKTTLYSVNSRQLEPHDQRHRTTLNEHSYKQNIVNNFSSDHQNRDIHYQHKKSGDVNDRNAVYGKPATVPRPPQTNTQANRRKIKNKLIPSMNNTNEQKNSNVSTEEETSWTWGTVKEESGKSDDLDDRTVINGDECPSDKIRAAGICVYPVP